MKRILPLAVVALSSILVAACGGPTAERAKDDVKGAASDLSNGVGTNGKGLDNGIGVNRPDGGSTLGNQGSSGSSGTSGSGK